MWIRVPTCHNSPGDLTGDATTFLCWSNLAEVSPSLEGDEEFEEVDGDDEGPSLHAMRAAWKEAALWDSSYAPSNSEPPAVGAAPTWAMRGCRAEDAPEPSPKEA